MLTDFGISKALQSANITGTGMILGTPHYMAPEQAKGQPVDGRADQYSLGVVGYRMLTGALPFSGDSVHTILYKHIVEEAPRVSRLRQDAPQYLTDPIQRALAKDLEQRFLTMEDFASVLWPERPVSPLGKTTPKPLPPAAGGQVSADTPTEHVASSAVAAAPTLPGMRGRTGSAAAARPAPKQKSSSKAGVFALLVIVAVAAGGYFVLRGRAGNGREHSTQNTPPPPSQKTATTAQSTATATHPPATPTTTPATQERRPQATPPGTTNPQPQIRQQQRPQGQQPQPPPPEVEQGYLTIDSDPPGEVFIDGVDTGPTPLYRQAVKPGSHMIRIEAPGYKTLSQRIQVDPGNTVIKRFPLIPQ
jgi:serine/threonine-protein kinase